MHHVPFNLKLFLIVLAAAVYLCGLPVKVMDIDAAQYASMSREMAQNHHYLTVKTRGEDYLDKPPLLFWLASISFTLFGVSTVAYKLPSLLLIIAGFFATYRLGKLLYDKNTGLLSAALLCSCQAFIYFTGDVRTDANLAAAVIIAVWQIMEFLTNKKIGYFFGGCVAVALAMLAKGPIGLMVPLCAIASYLLVKRDVKKLFAWYWPAGAALVLTLLAPMLWGLYHQFGRKGLVFYFWTQSFGRLTGQNEWRDSTGYFFFFHTFLWAFLPWMLVAYYGLAVNVARVVKSRFAPALAREALLLGATVIPFLALSFSHYKLPHYIFVVFPLVAIVTARVLIDIAENPALKKPYAFFYRAQSVVSIGVWIFALVCMTIFFPCKNAILWFVSVLVSALAYYYTLKKHDLFVRLALPSFLSILGVNLMLNAHFFPRLLSFQGGSSAGEYLHASGAPVDRIFTYGINSSSTDFYAGAIIPKLDSASLGGAFRDGQAWIYTERAGIACMERQGFAPVIVDSFPNMHVTMITSKFLFFKTRPQTVGRQYIVRAGPARNR